MQRLEVKLGKRAYPILIGPGLLRSQELLAAHAEAGRLLVVTDDVVRPLWMTKLEQGLAGRAFETCVLPGGEEQKTLGNVALVIDALVAARLNRDGLVLALGGGVIGDVAGFAAASYQRGIAIVQLPTTLLAMVDSSVGGKTGVNHAGGKNLIGAFHQPTAVIADTDTLSTLPDRQLRAGLTEIVKAALVADAGFFAWLEAHVPNLLRRDPAALEEAIRRACAIKAAIVVEDEREQGRRAFLNLGHTFGHAIESATNYVTWLHGEAVGAGMLLAADMSQRLGWVGAADVCRVERVLELFGLRTDVSSLSAATLAEKMKIDKKVAAGRIRLVLLKAIGKSVVTGDYDDAALRETLRVRCG